ncbi:Solute carrier family 46 member 3 [Lucilia cuprina]|nr:Solute carrier family 46 member 3 [Lucilia cuprina]
MLSTLDNENPNEESTLLAKFRRRNTDSVSTTASESLLNGIDMSTDTEFRWRWHTIRFYLVELMVLILVFAYNLSATILKNRIIFQTCTVVFDYNTTDCQKLSTRNTSHYIVDIEEKVQPYVARLFMTSSVIQSIVPAFCGTYVGAWSDRFGRKPLLIASFSGYFLFYAITSIISHFSDTGDVSPWYYLLASLPLSLLGDSVTYSIATLCYISDVSTTEERPYRMVFYEAVIYIGLMTGSFTSGYIYRDYTSSTLIFSISALCLLFATLFIIFVIPESLQVQSTGNNDEGNPLVEEQNLKNLFDIKNLKDMYKTCFKFREYETRTVILLIVSTLVICAFVVDGSVTVFYLFIREKFHWNIREYTTYETLSILVPVLGNIFGIWLLRKVIRIPLLNLAIVGLLSNVCNCLMKGFAAINWQLYLAILLGALKSIVNPMLRTVLTKILPSNELGKIFSFISALNAFVPFIASPLYTIVYGFTLKSFSGFFNILSANFYLLAIGLILVVIRKKQKYISYYESSARSMWRQIQQYQWGKFFHMFYIEPIVFILVFSHSLSGTIMRNEVIYQACTTIFHYNESDCLQLGTKNVTGYLQEIETEIQPYVANLFMIRTLLESIVPAICGVFIGSWSDHYGRKPLLLVSMIGFSCTYVIAAVICELSRYYPVNPWYYILAVIPHSILGGNCVFSVAAFCFISDVTDTKTRPYRMISLEAFLSVGLMVGSLLSSFVYAATSATFTFSLSGILMCLATAYIALYVPESLKFKSKESESNEVKTCCNELTMKCTILSNPLELKPSYNEHEKKNIDNDNFRDVDLRRDGEEVSKVVKNCSSEKKNNDGYEATVEPKTPGLFSYRHVKDMWITCFKTRPYYDRSIILLVTGTMFLAIFVLDGAMTVFYLFVREKFQWTIREFTFYETISHVTSVFHLSVVTLTLIAFLSDIIRSVIQGIATEPWHLYVGIAAGALKAVGGPMCRTIVSNIVPATDLGKIFSIKNILQSIAPFLAAPLYTIIYKASITSFPGLFNIFSAILYFIAFIFLLFVLRFKFNNREHYGQILK